MTENSAPSGVDTSQPSPARIHDYYLGGKENYAVDREAGDRALTAVPGGQTMLRENRDFLQRAVRYLAAEVGIRQFIDIGSGLPTQGNVHEVAQGIAPDARVAYVDNDPAVLAHNRELLAGNDKAITVSADMRRPDEILVHPDLRNLIDLDEPVAILLVAVLHFVTDDEDPWGVVDRLRGAMPGGSYLVLSHLTGDGTPPEAVAQATQADEGAGASVSPRSQDKIRRFLEGFELVPPGAVHVREWQPEHSDGASDDREEWIFGGVGRKV